MQVKSCIAQLGAASYMFSEVKMLLTLFTSFQEVAQPLSHRSQHRGASKTILRTTTTSQRLNSVVVMNVHRELTDALDITAVADDFVRGNSARKDIFG